MANSRRNIRGLIGGALAALAAILLAIIALGGFDHYLKSSWQNLLVSLQLQDAPEKPKAQEEASAPKLDQTPTVIVTIDDERDPPQPEIYELEFPDFATASLDFESRAENWNFERDIPEFLGEVAVPRVLPETLNLYIAETVDNRLEVQDVEGLPAEVSLAIWPDSPLIDWEQGYFLINPPTDRMEYYYIQPVTQDDNDFYFHAMDEARGVFLRRDEKWLKDTPLGHLFLASMAEQDKDIVVMVDEIPEGVDREIIREQIELARINQKLNPNNLEAEFREIWAKSQHGEEFNVVLEKQGDDISAIKAIINEYVAEREALQAESLRQAETPAVSVRVDTPHPPKIDIRVESE